MVLGGCVRWNPWRAWGTVRWCGSCGEGATASGAAFPGAGFPGASLGRHSSGFVEALGGVAQHVLGVDDHLTGAVRVCVVTAKAAVGRGANAQHADYEDDEASNKDGEQQIVEEGRVHAPTW